MDHFITNSQIHEYPIMKQISTIILLLSTMLCFAQNKDYKNLDKAIKYNNSGNWKKAIKYAEKALKGSPEWSQANLLIASIYIKNNQIKNGANYLLKGYTKNATTDIKGIEQVATLYYSNGLYQEALFYSKKVMDEKPEKYKDTNKIKRYIESSTFAIEAMNNPISFTPAHINNNINSIFSEYVNNISFDGTELLFTRRIQNENQKPQEDLYSFNLNDSTLTPLAFNTEKNEGAIAVSPNGSIYIYTACDRQNSFGGCDLFMRKHTKQEGWSKEYNLGENVNSKAWESQACFSPDGRYIYFISNRAGGVGRDDIWRSEITKEGFLPAENLGPKINSKKNEMSPFLHPDNLTLYFASDGHIGMGDYDIYISRRLNTNEKWEDLKNIGYPINTYKSENSLIVSNNGKTAYYTSNKTGFGLEDIFVFDLPEEIRANKLSQLEIEIITHEKGDEVVLKNVTFDSNSYELDKTSYTELSKLISYLKKNPQIELEIQGHTDNIGDETDNQVLSELRAKIVFEYLSAKTTNKLTYKGYGELKPIISNQSKEGRMTNRRTSFVIQ